MIDRLKHILMMSDEEVLRHSIEVLGSMGYTVHTDGSNYIFGVPNKTCTPVVIHAHVGTYINPKPARPTLVDWAYKISGTNEYLDASNRCGVAGTIEAVSLMADKPFVLFTNVGEKLANGAGMRKFIESNLIDPYVNHIYIVLGANHSGHNLYRNYGRSLPDKIRFVFDGLGYVSTAGPRADEDELYSKLHVGYVDVSMGYYHPNTLNEFVLKDSYTTAVDRLRSLARKIHTSTRWSDIQEVPQPKELGPAFVHTFKDEIILEVSAQAAVCVMCNRADRPNTYVHELGHHLCHVCSKKVLAYGKMSHQNLLLAMQTLEKEQLRTKLANKLRDSKANTHMPCCPVCKSSKDVTWSKLINGFRCSRCTGWLPDGYNGVFWVLNNEKIYVRSAQVYHSNMSGSKLLKVTNLFEHPYVKTCDICKNPCMNYKSFIQEGAILQPMHLCKVCESEMEQVCNLYNIKE